MMDTTKLFIALLVGVAIGAAGLYGAAITGYIPFMVDKGAADAAGLSGQAFESHVIAVRDDAMLGTQVKEMLAMRGVIRGMLAEGVIRADDLVFIHNGRMLDANGNARMMSILFVAVLKADGQIDVEASRMLASRCLEQSVLADKMILALDSQTAIISEAAVAVAAKQLTAQDAFDQYILASRDVFGLLGIGNIVEPFGYTGGGTNPQ